MAGQREDIQAQEIWKTSAEVLRQLRLALENTGSDTSPARSLPSGDRPKARFLGPDITERIAYPH